MSKTTNIMIVGVGGQGTLLASKIMGDLYQREGYDVKVSEVHGMSQRGGSVVTYVRFGDQVASPIIDLGQADIILSFEKLEALRWLPYLKKGGIIITNIGEIAPMPVITGAAKYPEEIESRIGASGARLVCVDAAAIAKQAGIERAVNVALIGVFARHSGIALPQWESALKNCVKAEYVAKNLQALRLGYDSEA